MRSTARAQLFALLNERSFRRGTFTLTSGKTSDFFIDCKPAVLTAEGHRFVGELLYEAIDALEERPAAVAGVELGGCPLASAISLTSALGENRPIDAVYIRKAKKGHGTGKQIEGADGLLAGASFVIVEDTVTTGGSTLRAIETVREAGFEVSCVFAIVDRLEGGREAIEGAGVRFESLYTRRDFMGEA